MSAVTRSTGPGGRRVLMVAYSFPPVGGVGVERTLKHVTYLPELGWAPVVVGPANSAYRLVDPGSLARIPPGVPVLRAPTLEPGHLRRAIRWVLHPAPSRASDPAGTYGSSGASRPRGVPGGSGSPLASLRGRANGLWAMAIPWLFFPDDQLLWIPSAAVAGMIAVRRYEPDAIYSSSPPVSGHLAAGLVKVATGLPWIADFRDPWIGNAFARPLPAGHRWLQAAWERWIVHRADAVILATRGYRDRYVERYPALANRFVAIPNGYDRAELAQALAAARRAEMPAGEAGVFRLAYSGSIYGEQELTILLDGIERLLAAQPALRDRLRVELIGWLNERNRAIAEARVPALEPVVRLGGHLPRVEALARVATADAALILTAAGPGRADVVMTKLYEYLGLDRQVFAVAPPGEMRRILAELDWGVSADPTPEGVASGIARLLDSPAPAHHADPDGRFDRRMLAGRLAAILDEVSTRRDR